MTKLSEREAAVLNNAMPGNQNVGLGTRLRALEEKAEQPPGPAEDELALIHLTYEITSDLTGGLDAIECPCDLEVLDVIVQARATVGEGGVIVRKGTSWISLTIPMIFDRAITRIGRIDDDYSSFAKGEYINLMTETSGDRGLVTVVARRI